MSDDCEIILTQEQYASMRRKLEEKDELNNHLLQQYKKIVEELDVGLAQKKLVMEAYQQQSRNVRQLSKKLLEKSALVLKLDEDCIDKEAEYVGQQGALLLRMKNIMREKQLVQKAKIKLQQQIERVKQNSGKQRDQAALLRKNEAIGMQLKIQKTKVVVLENEVNKCDDNMLKKQKQCNKLKEDLKEVNERLKEVQNRQQNCFVKNGEILQCLNKKFQKLEKENQRLTEEVKGKCQRLLQVEQKSMINESNITVVTDQMTRKLNQITNEFEVQNGKLKASLLAAQQTIERLTNTNIQIQQQNGRIKSQLAKAQTKSASIPDKITIINQLLDQKQHLQEQKNIVLEQYNELKKKYNELVKENRQMDAVNERQATKINEAKKDAEEEMQMISRLMQEKQQARKDILVKTNEITMLKQKAEHFEGICGQKANEIQKLKKQQQRLQKSLQQRNHQLYDQKNQIGKLISEKSKQQANYKKLLQIHQNRNKQLGAFIEQGKPQMKMSIKQLLQNYFVNVTNNIENLKLTEIGEKEELLRAEHDHMRNNIDSVMKTISEKLNKGLKQHKGKNRKSCDQFDRFGDGDWR